VSAAGGFVGDNTAGAAAGSERLVAVLSSVIIEEDSG